MPEAQNHQWPATNTAPASYSLRENIEGFFDTVTLKKFPKLSYIIVTCSLLENLSEAGMMGLMAIYFQTLFNLEPSKVTVALHIYNFCKYFGVLLGAVLADSYFGRVKLIIYGQIIFFVGNTLLSTSSAIRRAFPSRLVLLLALVAKVVGRGFVLPCLIPLAADQIHQQEAAYEEMKAFFVFYFAISQVCDFLSKLFLPLVLEVSCFNLDSCYPLAFGIPAILSCFSLGIDPFQYAIRMKIKKRKKEKKAHWLYYANDRYDMKFIEDIKSTIDVLLVPVPLYWSLYDQQFTSWTLQAARLNTEISPQFRIMPEQTQALEPFFFLLFIPIFHFFIYDLVYPFRFFRTLLRRMVTGGFLIAMAFMMASSLELRIEFSYPDFPASDVAYIYAFNGLDSAISIEIENQKVNISRYSVFHLTAHSTEDTSKYTAIITYSHKQIITEVVAKRKKMKNVYKDISKTLITGISVHRIFIKGVNEKFWTVSYAMVGPEPVQFIRIGTKVDKVYKHSKGRVRLRVICVDKLYCQNAPLRLYPKTWYISRPIIVTMTNVSDFVELKMLPGVYEVYLEYNNNQTIDTLNIRTGGVYTLMAYLKNNIPVFKQFEITPPNKISILWMIPQYIVLSISTVLFRISAFAFIYTETPDQMKSLAWSMCYMNLSTGNIITVIFGGSGKPSTNFLIFSIGMFLFMFFFIHSAATYKYTHKYQERPTTTRKSLLNIF